MKGWYGNRYGHSLASRGIKSEFRTGHKGEWEASKERAFNDELEYLLEHRDDNEKFDKISINLNVYNRVFHEMKNNQEKYGIDEITNSVGSFYIRWKNGSITKVHIGSTILALTDRIVGVTD